MKRKIELLAPAGSWDAFIAAVNNGADAVYLGGKNFSARAFANNFDHDELTKAVNYAHLLNVKVYVTLNTLITDFEFENVIKEIDFLYSINVDALIIQDLGVYYYIKNKYPDFELHASTQMHVHNLSGVKTCKKLGFKRVVVARESSLDFISEACKEDIEIETFVHGAICVSYSGQCLMSSVTKSRSANKGMCAQCCRLAYDLVNKKDNSLVKTDTKYLLSPKDMMLIDQIPELIDAGVASFKIEGRMKSPTYVGYVTRLYRKAIDSYLDGRKYKISDDELKNIKYIFNRNFTNSYLLNDDKDIFGQDKPNHLGVEIGKVIKVTKESFFVRLTEDLCQYDGIRIVSGNKEYGQIVNFLSVDENFVSKAIKGQVCEIKSSDNIKFNDKVFKTIDTILEKEIGNTPLKKININLDINIEPNKNIEIIAFNNEFKYKYESNIKAQIANKAPVDKDNFLKHFTFKETVYDIKDFNYKALNIFIPVKQINELKHEFFKQLDNYRLNLFKRNDLNYEFKITSNLNDDSNLLDDIDNIQIVNKVVNNENKYELLDINLVSEIGGLIQDYDNKIASYTLNIANSYSYEFLLRLGFKKIIVSSEINKDEVKALIDNYKRRNNININPIILDNTHRTLMYLKRNPFNKYVNNIEDYYLTDGTNSYLLKNNSDFIEIIESNEVNKKAILKEYKHIAIKQ